MLIQTASLDCCLLPLNTVGDAPGWEEQAEKSLNSGNSDELLSVDFRAEGMKLPEIKCVKILNLVTPKKTI